MGGRVDGRREEEKREQGKDSKESGRGGEEKRGRGERWGMARHLSPLDCPLNLLLTNRTMGEGS